MHGEGIHDCGGTDTVKESAEFLKGECSRLTIINAEVDEGL